MNYFGSKSRQAKYIVPIIQKYIDDNDVGIYLEPFVGGAKEFWENLMKTNKIEVNWANK